MGGEMCLGMWVCGRSGDEGVELVVVAQYVCLRGWVVVGSGARTTARVLYMWARIRLISSQCHLRAARACLPNPVGPVGPGGGAPTP